MLCLRAASSWAGAEEHTAQPASMLQTHKLKDIVHLESSGGSSGTKTEALERNFVFLFEMVTLLL